MDRKTDRIIMLPHVQKDLEKEALELIEDKKLEQAIEVIDQLIFHEIDHINLHIAKSFCLVGLNRIEEALIFIEGLLGKATEDYYVYLDYYVSLLFKNNEFEEILKVIKEESPNLPKVLEPVFSEHQKMAFQMSEKMKLVQAKELLTSLEAAINQDQANKQWLLINQLRKLQIQPPSEIRNLLRLDSIHPVVKTSLFNWYRTIELNELLKISKFDTELEINPKNFPNMVKHPVVEKTLIYLLAIEQENPTLYKLIEDIFIKYIYVHYPILYSEDEAKNVANALKVLSEKSLYGEVIQNENEKIQHYIDEISLANRAYYEVIHE